MIMREIINLIESASGNDLPHVVYHGTSDIVWKDTRDDTLFLTSDRDDAANYADERVGSDYTAAGLDADDPAPAFDL